MALDKILNTQHMTHRPMDKSPALFSALSTHYPHPQPHPVLDSRALSQSAPLHLLHSSLVIHPVAFSENLTHPSPDRCLCLL